MDQVSNRTLAILLVTAIVVSLGATVYTLNYLGSMRGMFPTGRAPTDYGRVNLTVSNQVSIILNRAIIDFGAGFVNTSCSYVTNYNFANLTAHNDSFQDSTDCWTGTPAAPGNGRAFLVENNGNLNASVAVRGSDNATFFNNFVTAYPSVMAVYVRGVLSEGTGLACPAASLGSTWSLLSNNMTVCSRLNFDPASDDEIAVEVNVQVPRDIPSGEYNSSVVEFYAVQST